MTGHIRIGYLIAQWLFTLYLVSRAEENCLVNTRLAESGSCDCSGSHLLRVEWFGRLGNNLLQLAHVLHLAQQIQAEVTVPHRDFLSRHDWSFRGSNKEKCQIAITDEFFFSDVCPGILDRSVFSASAKREILQTHVLPVFQIPLKHSRDTVVVHVRGGDVFVDSPPNPHYTQPPLIFYDTILQLHELANMKIILCTEDDLNPVVKLMQKQYGKRLTIVTGLEEAIGIILGARHLILGQSSFSEMLGMMAPDLESIYVPFCIGRTNLYTDLRQQGWGLPGYCFEYTNYIPIDDWQNSPEQLQLMTNLTLNNMRIFPIQN